MIEEFLMIHGCPHCGDGLPAIVTMMFHDPQPCDYGKLEGLNREEFIAAHQAHRSAHIMACRKLEEEE